MDTDEHQTRLEASMIEKTDEEILKPSLSCSDVLCHNLLELAPYSISLATIQEGRFLLVNAAFCRNTGYSMNEIIGRTASDLKLYKNPADRARLVQAIRESGAAHRFETIFRTKNGGLTYNQVSARAMEFQGEECLMGITTFTESLTKAHRALRESEARFGNILQSIAEGYYELDLQGNMTFFNDPAARIIGYPHDELMGMNFRQYVSPESAVRLVGIFNDVLTDGGSNRMVEYDILRKDGTILKVETSAGLKRDAKGQPIGFYGIVRDRTSQKKAEDALRQSEESYRGLLELAPDAISVNSLEDGRYLQVNNAFFRKTGYSMAEIIGRTPEELNIYVDPLDQRRLIDMLARQGRVEGIEITYRMKDGSHSYHLVSAGHIRFKERDCLLLIAKDINQLKEARDSLRLSEEKYRKILETMEEGYYEVDLHGNYSFFNEASCKIHGYPPEELIGKSYQQYLLPEKAIETNRIYNQIFRTGVPADILDHTIIQKDGTLCMVEMSAYPTKDATGRIVGFWGICRDRTERKKAEMALQESEARLSLIFDNANEAIYITQEERIRFPNPQTTAITGYTRRELSGFAFIDLVHPEDKQALYAEQRRNLDDAQRPGAFSFRILNKAQKTLWVELSTVAITWEGQPAKLNFLRDVTFQKKMEAQLLQAKKMEAVGTLAGGIAHDFNNLLMGIQGNASLALMDLTPEHQLYQNLKSIEQYVVTGSEMTKRLLGAAKGGKYEVRPTNMNTVLEQSAELFGRTKKEISIHCRLQEQLYVVEVDRGQIEQVLLNLYVNAFQAMPEGGDLYLESSNVTLDEYYVRPYGVSPGQYVKLSVTDTGLGIDPQDQRRIFNPFFTTKDMGKGTGLGLASTYGIITNHGGIINVYSEKGNGSTFNIYLPATEKEVVEGDQSQNVTVTGKESILFVDDEKGILDVAKLLLTRLGYKVRVANSGAEAIEKFSRYKDEIDLIMLDMIMPGMSGGETFDALKQIDSGIKVLLSSGYSINGQAQTILNRGCVGFIQKPFNMKQLSAKLREIFDLPR